MGQSLINCLLVSLLAVMSLLAASCHPVQRQPWSQVAFNPSQSSRNNPVGAHLLTTNRNAVDVQLQWAKHLTGPGGYVKNLFAGIDQNLTHAPANWIYFIEQSYRQGLIPVCRLAGVYQGSFWQKPFADAPFKYETMKRVIKNLVDELPLHEEMPLYIEIWNEPDLEVEWSKQPNAAEYGAFLSAVYAGIKELNKPQIKVLNAGLSPLRAMAQADSAHMQSFDVLASHSYPYNLPPELNNHNAHADKGEEFTIDYYVKELQFLRNYGRNNLPVMITETGYSLGDKRFNEFPAIDDELRATYMLRAFRDGFLQWPELTAVTPFQFSQGSDWKRFDWVDPDSATDDLGLPSKPTQQYEFVRLLAKPTQDVASVSGELAVDGLPAIKIEQAVISLVGVTDTSTSYKSISNKYGSYIIGNLLPGKYRLRIAAAGFEDYQSEAIELSETQNLKLDAVLKAKAFGTLKVNISERVANRILPDARLILVNSGKSTMSNAFGKAVFSNVVPGNYLLKIEKNAFQTAQIEVRVEANKTTGIDIAVIKDELFGHENLLANAGFEEGALGTFPLGWNDREGKSDPAFSAVEGNTFFSGSKSARMHPAGKYETILEQWTPYNSIVPGRNYRFYIWVKAVAATTSTESPLFAIKLAYFNNASEVKGLAIPVVAATTADGWSKYAIVGQAPQGAQRMRLEIYNQSKSHTLFVDDAAFFK